MNDGLSVATRRHRPRRASSGAAVGRPRRRRLVRRRRAPRPAGSTAISDRVDGGVDRLHPAPRRRRGRGGPVAPAGAGPDARRRPSTSGRCRAARTDPGPSTALSPVAARARRAAPRTSPARRPGRRIRRARPARRGRAPTARRSTRAVRRSSAAAACTHAPAATASSAVVTNTGRSHSPANTARTAAERAPPPVSTMPIDGTCAASASRPSSRPHTTPSTAARASCSRVTSVRSPPSTPGGVGPVRRPFAVEVRQQRERRRRRRPSPTGRTRRDRRRAGREPRRSPWSR